MAETDAEERSIEEARDRVGDTRQEEKKWLKMAARDQPQSHSSGMEGFVGVVVPLVGGEVEREVLFLLAVVLRVCRPPPKPWSIPILQASHVPVGAITIASFPALVEMACCIV
jgi:hypothetical protein